MSQIGQDLGSDSPDSHSAAIGIIKKLALEDVRDPAHKPVIDNKADWCRSCLEEHKFYVPLMELKEYDLIESLAAEAVSDGQFSPGSEHAQVCLVKTLLAAGKYDEALKAAKTYYNYCSLDHTPIAMHFLAQALINGPAQKDRSILHRFMAQQAAGAQPPPTPGAAETQPSDLGENVLKSIPIDPKPYQAKIDQLAKGVKTVETLNAQGNLLLLIDKGAEAKDLFELALDLAEEQKQVSAGVVNVARAIRARDGTVGGANAYIVSLRGQPGVTPQANGSK